jgi:hypothetical protein
MTFSWYLPLIGLAAVALGLVTSRIVRARRAARRNQVLSALREHWGKPVERHRDLDTCRAFAAVTGRSLPATSPLDEHTWRDLDMDELYAHIDRTHSSAGQLVLYALLRSPAREQETLVRRDRIIRLLQQDPHVRETVELALARLGFSAHAAQVVSLLWESQDLEVPLRTTLRLMAGLAVFSVLSPAFLGPWGWALLGGTFAVNYVLHYRIRFRFGPEILALRYLASALATAGELGRQRMPGLEEYVQALAECHRAGRPVARSIALISSGRPADLVYEYFNILFLLEARGLARALRAIRDPAFRKAFLTLGELDALQAAASFREGLPYHCAPDFEEGRLALQVEELFHPLLPSPVPNSISLDARGTLITGSNMSGKSTFLRALGVNAILAQTVHICVAKRYRASRLRVLSSMRSADDLLRGKSTYWAEAERLLEIVQTVDGKEPSLCLIDELLAGTNSEERLAVSAEVLDFLSRQGALLVSTTHDVELTTQLQHALDCYHFMDHASAEGVHFDYRLRPGVARARNAIRLLGILGFPPHIVEGAMRRVRAGVVAR